MHQTISSLITDVESQICESSPQIDRLSQLKNQILLKMQYIDQLNAVYKEKSQLSFIHTFKKIMHHLSDELKNAVQAYQNIDYEISQDQKCLLLTKQKDFFKSERKTMEDTLINQLQRLQQLKSKNQHLKNKRSQLKAKTILRQKKVSFYQQQNRSLSLRLKDSIQHDNSIKKHTESTKYPTSGQRTRMLTYTSHKRRQLFENVESQINRSNVKQFSLTKNQKRRMNNTTQHSSRVKVNSFII